VVPRTAPAAALAATLARLMTGDLPKPQDFEALAPVIGTAWVRRVPGHDLWIFFRFDAVEVTVVSLTTRSPVRVEEWVFTEAAVRFRSSLRSAAELVGIDSQIA
jgi:hypothetical protein